MTIKNLLAMARHPMDHLFLVLCKRREVYPVQADTYAAVANGLMRSEKGVRRSIHLGGPLGRRHKNRVEVANAYNQMSDTLLRALWVPRWAEEAAR